MKPKHCFADCSALFRDLQQGFIQAHVCSNRLARALAECACQHLQVDLKSPLYFWLVSISVLPLARYMVPSEALLFPFVAIAVEQLVGWVRARGPLTQQA